MKKIILGAMLFIGSSSASADTLGWTLQSSDSCKNVYNFMCNKQITGSAIYFHATTNNETVLSGCDLNKRRQALKAARDAAMLRCAQVGGKGCRVVRSALIQNGRVDANAKWYFYGCEAESVIRFSK